MATQVMLVGQDGDAPHDASSSRGHTAKTLFQMILFYVLSVAFMGAHLVLVLQLHGRPVETSGIRQSIATAMGNFLALVAELMLMSGVGVAYEQILWRQFRQKSLAALVMDTLVSLPSSPWNLAEVQVIRSAWVPWLISLGCIMMPLAGMFPPGTLTVEFENSVVPTSLGSVPTMNISDWGFSDYKTFINHSFFDLDADLNWLYSQNRVQRLAETVLAQGRPVEPPTPCTGPCSYTLDIRGPRFHCDDVSARPNASLFPACEVNSQEEFVFAADMWELNRRDKAPLNNTFKISAFKDRDYNGTCEESTLKTYECHTTLADYRIEISNEENGTTTYKTEIRDDVDFWTTPESIRMGYYDYFFKRPEGTLQMEAYNHTDLSNDFARTQSYALAYAAVSTIAGTVSQYVDYLAPGYGAYSYKVNASLVVGSPYFGFIHRYVPDDRFTPALLQQYMLDLVISTISLNPPNASYWATWEPVDTMLGGNVFQFEAKRQFYAPYGACLAVAFLIYLVGIHSLFKNGGPADSSIPQYAMVPADDSSTPLRSDDETGSMEKRVGTDKSMSGYGG